MPGSTTTPGAANPEPRATMPGRRRWARRLMVLGGLVVVVAVVFGLVGVPALERFPLNTDVTVLYTGGFDLYVNQATLDPLATPTHLPMTVQRRVKVHSGGFSTAVVSEDDTIRPGSLTYHQDFQYLLNRRTMAFENGSQTIMFGEPAKVDIAGSYRVNFPMGTTASGTYPVLNTETDKKAAVTDGRGPHDMAGVTGVQVIDFRSKVKGPVSPYYHRWLVDNGFPASISPAQLEPRLAAYGVDVPALLAVLGPRLTSSEASLVNRVLSTPVPLDYTYFYQGTVAVEPRTGALIWVDTTAEGVDVALSLTGVDRLRPLLATYASIPEVAALSKALEQLAAAAPQKVVKYTWVQTRGSAQHVANLASGQIRTMNLLNAFPWLIGGVGLVLVGVGAVFWRRRPPVRPATPAAPDVTSERAA